MRNGTFFKDFEVVILIIPFFGKCLMVSKVTFWLLYSFENSRTNTCVQGVGCKTYDSLINIPFFMKYCVIFLLQMIKKKITQILSR